MRPDHFQISVRHTHNVDLYGQLLWERGDNDDGSVMMRDSHITGHRAETKSGIASEHLLATERIILAPREKEMKRCTRIPYTVAGPMHHIGTDTVSKEWERETNLEEKIFIRVFSNIVYRKKEGEMERLYAAMVTAQMTYRSSFFLTRSVSFFFFFYPLTLQTPITYSPYYLPLVFLSAISVERGGWGTGLFSYYYYFFLLFSAALSAQVIARESLLLAVSIFCFSFSGRKEKEKSSSAKKSKRK